LCEMDELKMGPVNVFLPRSAHTSHHFWYGNGEKIETFNSFESEIENEGQWKIEWRTQNWKP
jgi:hypothetical protein